jgi:hypothetical protein
LRDYKHGWRKAKRKSKKEKKRKSKNNFILRNLEKKNYVKIKDLFDITSPKYRRVFGLRTELTDKKGNPKMIVVASPSIVEYKVLKRKRKKRSRDWITLKRIRIKYGADAVLSFNKKTKTFKVDIYYKTVNLFFYFSAKEIQPFLQ